jgi:hypothetical protein
MYMKTFYSNNVRSPLRWRNAEIVTGCFAPVMRIFLSTPAQFAATQRKVEKEQETLEQQPERVSPGL